MCRTVHSLLASLVCCLQMIIRTFMTCLLMIENLVRMFLQTLYNMISFWLQLLSLIPICCLFILTSRLKCFMCGGGGPCPNNRGGACDCVLSLLALLLLFLIFRATGTLDKIFFSLGYTKATTKATAKPFRPTQGYYTECSRQDADTEYVFPVEFEGNPHYKRKAAQPLRIDDVYTDYTDFTDFNSNIQHMQMVTTTLNDTTKNINNTSTASTTMSINLPVTLEEKFASEIPNEETDKLMRVVTTETKTEVLETTEVTIIATYEDVLPETTVKQQSVKNQDFVDSTTELRLQDWTTVLYYLV